MTALAAVGWLLARPGDPPAAADEPPRAAAPATPDHVRGPTGCSGVACHGRAVAGLLPQSGWGTAAADRERWRSSDIVFRAYDPHTRAYPVLLEPRSDEIESRLPNPKKAHEDARCLACHSTPALAAEPTNPRVAEGVGCEACHGAAASWLDAHIGWPHGPGHTARYAAAGMRYLSDPATRAATCAGCHVGAPADANTPLRDMNHDLIAAGHPRLNFDYGTYLWALPPHWAEKDRDAKDEAHELRPASDEFTHWLVGRAVANAALDRLRADRARRGPWPELAEFDCYACHHHLTGGKKDPLGDRPGALVWNEPTLAAAFPITEAGYQRAALNRLMDAESVQAQAGRSASQWDDFLRQVRTTRPDPKGLAAKLANAMPRRWDEACHLYYALVAIDRATRPRRADPRLAELREALRFPPEADGVKYNCPRDFDPDKLDFRSLFLDRAK
jgi:hypothetical protein